MVYHTRVLPPHIRIVISADWNLTETVQIIPGRNTATVKQLWMWTDYWSNFVTFVTICDIALSIKNRKKSSHVLWKDLLPLSHEIGHKSKVSPVILQPEWNEWEMGHFYILASNTSIVNNTHKHISQPYILIPIKYSACDFITANLKYLCKQN